MVLFLESLEIRSTRTYAHAPTTRNPRLRSQIGTYCTYTHAYEESDLHGFYGAYVLNLSTLVTLVTLVRYSDTYQLGSVGKQKKQWIAAPLCVEYCKLPTTIIPPASPHLNIPSFFLLSLSRQNKLSTASYSVFSIHSYSTQLNHTVLSYYNISSHTSYCISTCR